MSAQKEFRLDGKLGDLQSGEQKNPRAPSGS